MYGLTCYIVFNGACSQHRTEYYAGFIEHTLGLTMGQARKQENTVKTVSKTFAFPTMDINVEVTSDRDRNLQIVSWDIVVEGASRREDFISGDVNLEKKLVGFLGRILSQNKRELLSMIFAA